MRCCLCKENLKDEMTFSQLLLLKSASSQVCFSCFATFKRISDPHCPTCYKEGVKEICFDCKFWKEQKITVQHEALFCYNEAMKNFFSSYKFEGDYELRKVFEKSLKQGLKSYRTYTIVPVPIGEKRFYNRGFNQVTGLLKAGKIPYQDLLEKRDLTASSSKNRKERLQTEMAFSIKAGISLPEKVLLFDDIYTTGTTLNRLKKLLLEAGCKEVCTFSLAR